MAFNTPVGHIYAVMISLSLSPILADITPLSLILRHYAIDISCRSAARRQSLRFRLSSLLIAIFIIYFRLRLYAAPPLIAITPLLFAFMPPAIRRIAIDAYATMLPPHIAAMPFSLLPFTPPH